jgi:FKBP-type peptidyl-prolyl cis-trans isomerase SlyD
MRTQVLSFYCTVKDALGNIISSSFNEGVKTSTGTVHLDGGIDLPFLRVAQELKGMKRGQVRRIPLKAEDAYGLYDDRLLIQVPRANIEDVSGLQLGHEVLAETEEGDQQLFRVVGLNPVEITLDGNHPLAGVDLVVELKITASSSSKEEPKTNGFISNSGQVLH